MKLPESMRALVLMGPDRLEMKTVPVPQPGPVEVLICVESCAICSTDVALIHEPFPGQPPYGVHITGHEYAGTVAAVGETVDELQVGDRVAVEAHNGCGRCRNCRLGDYTSCLNYGNPKKGHRANGFTTPGGNAGYVVNHLNTVHKIPDAVPFDVASLVTNLGCALYGYETLGGYMAGCNILVIGPGPLGLAAVAAGKALGANRVFLSGTRAARMTIGAKVGADRLISAAEEDPYQVVMQETGGIGVDYSIEVSGSQAGLDLAVKALKRNGKMLLLGIPHHPVPVDFKDLSLNDKDIIAIRGEGRANVARAISLLANGRVNIAPLVTHTFPIAKFEEAYRTFNERIGGAMKVIIKPQL